jgi:hypothetical protein
VKAQVLEQAIALDIAETDPGGLGAQRGQKRTATLRRQLIGTEALQRAGHLVGGQADLGIRQSAQDDDMLCGKLLRGRKSGCERHDKAAPDSNACQEVSPFFAP